MTISRSLLRALLCVAVFLSTPADGGAQAVPAGAASGPSLQPGDIVRLRIWREPDLSGDFQVDQAGIVTFPKLGPMRVSEESTESLKAKLVAGYQEYLRNPSIDIVLLRRVNVLGAVKNPGLYPVDATMTIADAIALAGGATPDGNRRKIELLRDGQRIAVDLADVMKIADLPLRSGDQLFVPERSWISRNPGVIAASLTGAISLVIALFLR